MPLLPELLLFFLIFGALLTHSGVLPFPPLATCPRVYIRHIPRHVCHLKLRCEILSSGLSASVQAA